MRSEQTRTYDRNNCIVFLKTKEAFGGLSNMAGGFPLRVNGIRIFTSEALYQACRFPHLPDVQRIVLGEPSPMTSKMKSKPYRKDSRPDWDQVRVRIMRWCLRVKLVQNWKAFGDLLLATDDKPIVEESRKDDFWGANPVDERTLVGMNVLGRLLMELREEFKSERRDALLRVDPLPISDFLLMGQPIPVIEALAQDSKRLTPSAEVSMKSVGQSSLFDQSALSDAKTIAVSMHEVNEQMPPTYANSRAAITNLKPYSEYKDSGLPWLGRVPGHWQTAPGFAAFREKQVKNIGLKEKRVLSLSYGRIVVKPEGLRGLMPDSFETYQIVEPGDIIIRSTDLQNDKTSLRIGIVRDHGIITSAYICMKITGVVLPEFGYQLLNTYDLCKVLYGMGSGLRQNLAWTDFKRMPVFLPSLKEQAAIVRFLDHATHRLDKAIRAKRKTIALLNEQKQAIIHRAVTRGLDADVQLKDSGISWLGQIPAHWEVWPLRRCISIRSGDFADPTRVMSEASETHAVPVIGGNGVMGFTDQSNSLNSTVVIGRVGALCGNVHEVNGAAWITDNALRITRIVGFDTSYLAAQLRVMNLNRLSNANAQPLITGGVVKSQRVAKPPITEQTVIASSLLSLSLPVDRTISRIEREIDLLREYRTRLIADVVTGKLDVREAAARLPEESAPDSAEDAADMSDETESTDEEATA